MPYSFSPNIPTDTLIREESPALQAYKVQEFSDQGCRHLLGLHPPQQRWEALRQMDTEPHHRAVRSDAFKKAVKAGLITWIPTSTEESGIPDGLLFWPPDADEMLDLEMKNTPSQGGGTEKPPVKKDQPTAPITSQSNQQSKKKESLTDKIISLIISGHRTPETIKRNLAKTEQISDSLIQRLIKLVLGLPESQRVDLATTINSLAENKELRKIKKEIADDLKGPEM